MTKPLALFITDTHLYERRAKFDEIESDNIELNKSLYKQAIKIAKEKGLDTIYHGGDIFHSRKSQSLNILNTFREILNYFKDSDIKLYAISGNHDKTDYSATESFIFPFEHHPNFVLVERNKVVNLTSDINLHLISFYEDSEYITTLKKHINEYKNILSDNKNVLLTHIGVSGAIMNGGKKNESEIGSKLFKNFDKVLVGHFHDRSELDKGRIVYIGAAYQHNFGEDENKGVAILHDDLSLEYINLDFPKYKNIEIDIESVSNSDIKDIIEDHKKSQNYYKIKINGSPEKISSKSSSINLLKDSGITVVNNNDKIIISAVNNNSIEVFDSDSIISSYKEFCEERDYNFDNGKLYLEKI